MGNQLKKGFTLFEMMIATTILVFVFGAMASLLMSSLGAMKSVGQFHQVYNDGRKAMQWINRDVKQSADVLSSATIDGTLYLADKDTLILRRASSQNNRYDFVVYDLIKDKKNYKGDDTYRLDRTYFKAFSLAGVALGGSSTSKQTVAREVLVTSNDIFKTSGEKVTVDLTVERLERKAKEMAVPLDTAYKSGTSSGSDSTQASLRLVSEVKARN